MAKASRQAPHGEPRASGPGFYARVYAVVRQVPPGVVTTYGHVATLLGSPRLARQVGFALSALRHKEVEVPVPWHRVINGRGRISVRGETFRGVTQEQLLIDEGIEFDDTGKTDLRRFGWRAEGVKVPVADSPPTSRG